MKQERALYAHEGFQSLLVAYLVLLLINQFKQLIFPVYLNWLLALVVVLGIFDVLFYKHTDEERQRTIFNTVLIWILGLLGIILVFIKTQDLGGISYIISILAGTLIILLGYSAYRVNDANVNCLDFSMSRMLFGIVVGVLLFIAIILGFFIGFISSFRIVLGGAFVLFLPGLFLSYLLFDRDKIDTLERGTLSFALSITVVPLLIFYLNLFGMRITSFSVFFVAISVILASWLFYRTKGPLGRAKSQRMRRGKRR
jgi:hypothetical protein